MSSTAVINGCVQSPVKHRTFPAAQDGPGGATIIWYILPSAPCLSGKNENRLVGPRVIDRLSTARRVLPPSSLFLWSPFVADRPLDESASSRLGTHDDAPRTVQWRLQLCKFSYRSASLHHVDKVRHVVPILRLTTFQQSFNMIIRIWQQLCLFARIMPPTSLVVLKPEKQRRFVHGRQRNTRRHRSRQDLRQLTNEDRSVPLDQIMSVTQTRLVRPIQSAPWL